MIPTYFNALSTCTLRILVTATHYDREKWVPSLGQENSMSAGPTGTKQWPGGV